MGMGQKLPQENSATSFLLIPIILGEGQSIANMSVLSEVSKHTTPTKLQSDLLHEARCRSFMLVKTHFDLQLHSCAYFPAPKPLLV